jgi:hypothetical protein
MLNEICLLNAFSMIESFILYVSLDVNLCCWFLHLLAVLNIWSPVLYQFCCSDRFCYIASLAKTFFLTVQIRLGWTPTRVRMPVRLRSQLPVSMQQWEHNRTETGI